MIEGPRLDGREVHTAVPSLLQSVAVAAGEATTKCWAAPL